MIQGARVMLWANMRRGPSISVPSPFDGDASVPWWYDKIAADAESWAANGVTDILFPSPRKTNAGAYPGADGYGVWWEYDIGSVDTPQFGGQPTRFGIAEKLRRAIAICLANGMSVHVDLVDHQRQGGKAGVYRYPSADGGSLGRFPKDPPCFRGDSPRVPEDPVPSPADDYAFGDELCPKNALPKDYVWDGLIQAGNWVFRTLGVQGARLDDMKGMNVDFMKAFMNTGAMASKYFFAEYASGNRNDTNWWVDQVDGRASAIDFDWHYNMAQPMCNDAGAGTFNMATLAGRGMIGNNPMKAVPFVESMDSDTNGFATIVENKALAYALLLGGEGLPMIYIRDYLQEPDCYGLKPHIDNMMWCHQNLANGPTVPRYGDQKVFVFERTGAPGMIMTLNNDVWNAAWHMVTIQTAFGANVELKDYTGFNETHYWTDRQGRVTIWVPPGANGMGYGCWSRVGLDQPIQIKSRSCTQQFFGALDLDIPQAKNGNQTVGRIWIDEGSLIHFDLDVDTTGWTPVSAIRFQVMDPSGKVQGGNKITKANPDTASASSRSEVTGWHELQLISGGLPTAGSSFTFTVNYTATKTLTKDQF